MEEGSHFSKAPASLLITENANQQAKQEPRPTTKRRIIRKRNKVDKTTKNLEKKRKQQKNRRKKQDNIDLPKKQNLKIEKAPASENEKQNIKIVEVQKKKVQLQLIEFQPSLLPQRTRKKYQQKQKLTNTQLMTKGVKFLKNPNLESFKKWPKALIVYQVPYRYKKTDRLHFGMVIKYLDRIITFDGAHKLWPTDQVEKSFHWTQQKDAWSCGHRVIFWQNKILSVGLDQWVKSYQVTEEKQQQKLFI